jgi:hypothetical protein
MKKPKYRVRVQNGSVIVEHRASFGPAAFSLLLLGYLCYCLLPEVKDTLGNFYTSHDPVMGVFAFFLLCIPALAGLSWFRFASGEVLYCGRNELRLARRRTWGRWHRFRFPAQEVKKFRRVIRGTSKSRNYPVLTFDVQAQTYDILEDLGYTDSDRVLRACRAMGFDVITDEVGDAMLKDIEKRGWWINPFRTDDLGASSDSSQK